MILDLDTKATLVTVMRHGAVAGRAHVYRGALDDEMTPQGMQQMHTAVKHLTTMRNAPPIDTIVSSSYRRTRDFAQTLAAQIKVPFSVIDAFGELNFGDWEGMTPDEAGALDPAAHALFRDPSGNFAAPNGESVRQFQSRVLEAWNNWLRGSCGGHRLLVTHAGVMRALLMHLFELPHTHAYRFALPEAAHFQVSLLTGEAPILLNLNSCAD